MGCFSGNGSLTPALEQNIQFATSGTCQIQCGTTQQLPVMALIGGTTCYCGSELIPLNLEVDSSKCNTHCAGYGSQNCGGIGYYQMYLTGTTGDVQQAPNVTVPGTSSSSSNAAQTVVVTASATKAAASNKGESDGGPNKVGIAVGVVVGVVVIAAAIGGFIFYMRQKRRREIEEEHKAQAAVNSFVGSRLSDTKSDSRLDPSMASSYRRESIGSIADERDFSRRILQVRNPDRGSMQSVA